MHSLSRFVAFACLAAAPMVGASPAPKPPAPVLTYATPHTGSTRGVVVGPHLTYYGGRVLAHIKVDVVVWSSWSYDTTVPLTGTRSITSFARGITASRYIDWLSEYDTPTQQIGRGTFDALYTVHPPASSNGTVVTDAQIKSVLSQAITTAKLPKPSADRVYVVFFRKGQVVSRPEGNSVNLFCAYHDTVTYPLHSVYYVAIPYELTNRGCRPAPTGFDSVTTVVSHELVEAITDPGIGLHRIAWYDKFNGEIGDICAHSSSPGPVIGGDGVRYVVQREWSNRLRGCTLIG
jgi:hypothetical protein